MSWTYRRDGDSGVQSSPGYFPGLFLSRLEFLFGKFGSVHLEITRKYPTGVSH